MADTEDAVQELVAAAWQAWPRFDESRGKARTFISRVMRRRLASQTRRRLAQKRGGLRQQVALDDVGDAIAIVDGADSTQLALDVAEAVATLPAHLQLICHLLKKYTVAEVARMLGMTRSALAYRIRLIGRAFEEAGWEG